MGKAIKNAVLILLFLTLTISTVFLAYLHFFAADDQDLSGEWTANLDMTEQAAVAAYSWLQDIEGVSVSLDEVKSYMQDLTIQVNLTFEQTGHSEGTFYCSVSPESYDGCKQAAYEGFAVVFQEMLARRLGMAGYTGSTDQAAVEALVTETFGMSTVSYLMSYGPALLPYLEDLQVEYDGSGTYEADQDVLTRQFGTGGAVVTKAEYYIRKDSNLILSEEIGVDSEEDFSSGHPMVYTLHQPSNQE